MTINTQTDRRLYKILFIKRIKILYLNFQNNLFYVPKIDLKIG